MDDRLFAEWWTSQPSDREVRVPIWLHVVYGHRGDRARPHLAARMLADTPDLLRDDPYLACAVGDVATVGRAIQADPGWANTVGPSWHCRCGRDHQMAPLVGVTHSSLVCRAEYRDRLAACVDLLVEAGADPNQHWHEAGRPPFSALYGAAGRFHDEGITRRLLVAGAHADDPESLYHAVEHADPACVRLLLEHRAHVVGTHAMFRALDFDRLETLRLLLRHTEDVNERSPGLDTPLHHAIRRRRSVGHIDALLAAGADAFAITQGGISAYRLALRYGLRDAAERLHAAGAAEVLPDVEVFLAACAAGDRAEAMRIHATRRHWPAALPEDDLRMLPNLAAEWGTLEPVRLMLDLGWPVGIAGGVGWVASALNHAVARGDAVMTRLLLERGARWSEPNGYEDTVNGTLAWCSRNAEDEPGDPRADYVGCAAALLDHGLPLDVALESQYAENVMTFFRDASTE